MFEKMWFISFVLCLSIIMMITTQAPTPRSYHTGLAEKDILKIHEDKAMSRAPDHKFLPGQIFCVGKPFRVNDPLSWYAGWTKWMQQDRGEPKTRDLWHCGLIVSPSQMLEVTGVSFDALKLSKTENILKIKERNVVVYDFDLADEEREKLVQTAWDTYYRGRVPFNHPVIIGLTLSNLGNKAGLWPHWGWPEKNIRYGFICPEFLAYCFSEIGLYFRPGMDWWEGTTTDDIDDYSLKNAEIVYQNWVG